MFIRLPRSSGHMSEQLGLWEFQSESEATEMIQRRRNKKDVADQPEQERPLPNFGRQVSWGQK